MSKSSQTVGYRAPPSASQFRKGQSGNPGGRPKGARNNKTIMKALAETVVGGAVPGQEGPATLREAIIAKLAENAVKGDMRAINKFLERMDAYDAEDEGYCREAELAAINRYSSFQLLAVMRAMNSYQGEEFELIARFVKNVIAEWQKLEPAMRMMFDENGAAKPSAVGLNVFELEAAANDLVGPAAKAGAADNASACGADNASACGAAAEPMTATPAPAGATDPGKSGGAT